jgi:hypothetical protein
MFKNLVSTIQAEDLSVVVTSLYSWSWEVWDWSQIWDEVLRECARIFDGCPTEGLPAIIFPRDDHRNTNGMCYIDSETPCR